MTHRQHLAQQLSFYEQRAHAHLRPRADDHYAAKIVSRLVAALGVQRHHCLVELGASFGRFTFPLLEHCHSVIAVDLSERVLQEFVETRQSLKISEERCRVLCADVQQLTREQLGQPVDFVVGFFILHHLPDITATLHSAAGLLRPPGALAFVEPNRRNPLFLAQVAVCRDMSWREEKGLFELSAAKVKRASLEAGLTGARSSTFGFFPPQLVNRFPWARRMEARLESTKVLSPVLPFLLLTASCPEDRTSLGGG